MNEEQNTKTTIGNRTVYFTMSDGTKLDTLKGVVIPTKGITETAYKIMEKVAARETNSR